MTIYVLFATYCGDTRVKGLVIDKGVAVKFAKARGNWFEEFDDNGCLSDNLAYLTKTHIETAYKEMLEIFLPTPKYHEALSSEYVRDDAKWAALKTPTAGDIRRWREAGQQ